MLDYLDLGDFRLHGGLAARGLVRATGLTGPQGIRGDAINRPDEDGAVEPGRPRRGPRIIVLEGEVFGADEGAAWAAWEQLGSILDGAVEADMLLTFRKLGQRIDLQAYARLVDLGPPVFDIDNYGPFVAFQATLRAADPRFYSSKAHIASAAAPNNSAGLKLPLVFPLDFVADGAGGTGEATVTNGGNAKTWPLIVVDGPISGPVLENETTGELLAFPDLTLASGESLTIDMQPARRSAMVNAADVRGKIRWSDATFFGISKEATETIKFFGLSTGYGAGTRLTVTWRDAYTS